MKAWDWVVRGVVVAVAIVFAIVVRPPRLDGPIDFRISGGISGGGHGCTVHIELDGSATRTFRGSARPAFRVSRSMLDELRGNIEAARFATLESPGSSVADDFFDVVSVRLDGEVYSVSVGEARPIPPRLDAVIKPLRALADEAPDCVPRSPTRDTSAAEGH